MKNRRTITDVAQMFGISTRTIFRWEKCGKIPRCKRDYRGWRVFLDKDIENIRKLIGSLEGERRCA